MSVLEYYESFSKIKPRVNFCHACGKKLRGRHHMVIKFKDKDHEFVFHKDCGNKVIKASSSTMEDAVPSYGAHKDCNGETIRHLGRVWGIK